jgi:hypothetical protein
MPDGSAARRGGCDIGFLSWPLLNNSYANRASACPQDVAKFVQVDFIFL